MIGLHFLGRPSTWYSSLLALVFSSSEGCECDRASIYMSLQGWQAHGFRQALSLSSAYCASSEGCACDGARNYLCVVASVVNSCHVGRPSA